MKEAELRHIESVNRRIVLTMEKYLCDGMCAFVPMGAAHFSSAERRALFTSQTGSADAYLEKQLSRIDDCLVICVQPHCSVEFAEEFRKAAKASGISIV